MGATMQASEIMTREVVTVSADTSTAEIARLLLAHGISAVPVVDGSGMPIGAAAAALPERAVHRCWPRDQRGAARLPRALRGEAAEIYLRWERDLKPRGFRLAARVLGFPHGMPGDIGLFLVWGE
jgi:CBS domain-containing protein